MLTGAVAIHDSRQAQKKAMTAIRNYGKGQAPVREYIIACHKYKKLMKLEQDLFWELHKVTDIRTAYKMATQCIRDAYTNGILIKDWAIAQARMQMIADGYIPTNIFGGLDENILRTYNPYARPELAMQPDMEPKLSKTRGKVYNDIVFDDDD